MPPAASPERAPSEPASDRALTRATHTQPNDGPPSRTFRVAQDWNEWIAISSGRVFLVDPDSQQGPSAAFAGAPTLPCEGCGRLLEKKGLGTRGRLFFNSSQTATRTHANPIPPSPAVRARAHAAIHRRQCTRFAALISSGQLSALVGGSGGGGGGGEEEEGARPAGAGGAAGAPPGCGADGGGGGAKRSLEPSADGAAAKRAAHGPGPGAGEAGPGPRTGAAAAAAGDGGAAAEER